MPEELGSGCQRALWPQVDPLRCLVLRLFLCDPFLLGHLGFRMLSVSPHLPETQAAREGEIGIVVDKGAFFLLTFSIQYI